MTQKRVYRTMKQRDEINTVDNRPRSDGLRETRIKAAVKAVTFTVKAEDS